MDLVPGQVTYFWFTPTRTGTFDILCFELCAVYWHFLLVVWLVLFGLLLLT